jgi:asparagine synthase (glutamine-hydrolysing)
LVAFAFSLSDRFKIRDGECKWLLRQLAKERVPLSLLDQPKTGFSLPYEAYLRKQWRPYFESLVFGKTSEICSEYLDMEKVKSEWDAFLTGQNAPLRFLWAVFTFVLWAENRNSVPETSS